MRQAVTSVVITTKRDARSHGIATVDQPARLYVAPINATLVIHRPIHGVRSGLSPSLHELLRPLGGSTR